MIQAHYIFAAADLTLGGTHVVMWVMGSGFKYRWSFARLSTHLSAPAVQSGS